MSENPSRITADEAKALIAAAQPVTFVDSRNAIAWGASRVKIVGAIRIAVDDVERHLSELPAGHRLIVYCT